MKHLFPLLLILVSVVALQGQAPRHDNPPRPGQIEPRPVRFESGGRHLTYQAAELPRYRAANLTPPRLLPPLPPNRPGQCWRWAPWHGWVMLPVATAPVELVLPEAYALPQQVTVYQQPASTVQVICPHCGKPLQVELP